MIMTDIKGNKFGNGKDHVDAYSKKVEDRISLNKNKINEFNKKLSKTKNESKRNNINKEIYYLTKQNHELSNILHEIKELEKSSNTYDLVINSKYEGGDGETKFNKKTGHIDIMFGNESALAHELVNAYQGLKGDLSFNVSRQSYNVGLTYDIFDEVEAYQRSMFYSVLFEDITDENSFYHKFVSLNKNNVVNKGAVLNWSDINKSKLDKIPQIKLTTSSLIEDMTVSAKIKLDYGKLSFEQFQEQLKKGNIKANTDEFIEQYKEVEISK